MPSINRHVTIHRDRRIVINTCEGYVGISDETREGGNFQRVAQIGLTREQAQELVRALTEQMEKHY